MAEKIVSFKQLRIWQKGMEVVKDVYRLTKQFPQEELYGITSQARRAAVSIPTNVAEGFKRRHKKEYRHFLAIANGSLAELETLIIIAYEVELTRERTVTPLFDKFDHLYRMITVLSDKLVE